MLEISFERMSDFSLTRCFEKGLVLERAGHIPPGLIVLRSRKLINISPMFSNFVGHTL